MLLKETVYVATPAVNVAMPNAPEMVAMPRVEKNTESPDICRSTALRLTSPPTPNRRLANSLPDAVVTLYHMLLSSKLITTFSLPRTALLRARARSREKTCAARRADVRVLEAENAMAAMPINTPAMTTTIIISRRVKPAAGLLPKRKRGDPALGEWRWIGKARLLVSS